MSAADDVKNAARLWISRLNDGAGLEGSWRLQRIDRRSRKTDSEGVTERPAKIRRFAKGIPANYVDEAVKFLISLAPYTDIVFNGTKLDGTYAPTRTWWERDEGATVDRGQMRENTYTLYQDLVDWESVDSIDFDAGGSCSETVHMQYEYDAFSIDGVSLPKAKQGLTVSVQAVSRNEDGTFNYAVVTRKAKTAIGTKQVIKCDEYQTVTQQVYQNLYGEEGGYLWDDEIPISEFPEPCNDKETGRLIELSPRKNDDCTYDVTVTETISHAVSHAEHIKQKTLRGVTETVVERNAYDGSIEVHDIGERAQAEKNPDGTYTRSFTRVIKEDVGDIGSSCQQTMFEHSHVETENVATRPEEEAELAGDGKTYQVQARVTEEGTWDVSRTTTIEIRRVAAQRTKQKTLRGVTETIVDRNVDDDSVEVYDIGERVQVEMTPGGKWNRTVTRVVKEDVGEIGLNCQRTVFEHSHVETENVATRPEEEAEPAGDGKTYQVQARVTEEGTWDVSRTTTTELRQPRAQHIKQKTLRGVTETIVDRNVDDDSVEVTEIGERVQIEKTPGGKWNRTITRIVSESIGVVGKSCSSTLSTHTDVTRSNVPDGAQPEPWHQVPEVNVEKTVDVRRTDEGTWDVHETKTTHSTRVTRSVSNTKTETTVTTVTSNDTDLNPVATQGNANATPNDHGSATTSVTEVTPHAVESDWITWTSNNETPTGKYTYRCGVKIFRNLQSVPRPLAGVNANVSVGINQWGLYDGQISYSDLVSYTSKSGGTGGAGGGIQNGKITFYETMTDSQGKRWIRACTADVRVFYGIGNEGTEADTRSHAYFYPGLNLGSRMYMTAEPSFGPWKEAQ